MTELRWAIRAPCNHELNVQQQAKKTKSMLSTPAFSLSFVASRRSNENTHSNGKIGHDLCPIEQNQEEKMLQTLVGAKIRILRGSQLTERVGAAVAELRWAIRAPCNHELNVQKQKKTKSMLSTPAFSLSFVASKRTNENIHSNGEIGHDLCPIEQNQEEKKLQTLVEAKIRIHQGSQPPERVGAAVAELR